MPEFILTRAFVRERFYLPGETIIMEQYEYEGLIAVCPGIARPAHAALPGEPLNECNQVLSWRPVSAWDEIYPTSQLVSKDAYMPPFRGGGHADLNALCAIASIVVSAPSFPKRRPLQVLELGTAYGNSALNVLRAAPRARVVTVNALPEQISGTEITQAFTMDEIGRVLRDNPEAGDRYRIVHADTLTLDDDLNSRLEYEHACALLKWTGTEPDIVVVDACHDLDYAYNDICLGVGLGHRNTIVLVHDVYPGSGPYQAMQQFAMEHPGHRCRVIEGTWWGVVALPQAWDRLEIPEVRGEN